MHFCFLSLPGLVLPSLDALPTTLANDETLLRRYDAAEAAAINDGSALTAFEAAMLAYRIDKKRL